MRMYILSPDIYFIYIYRQIRNEDSKIKKLFHNIFWVIRKMPLGKIIANSCWVLAKYQALFSAPHLIHTVLTTTLWGKHRYSHLHITLRQAKQLAPVILKTAELESELQPSDTFENTFEHAMLFKTPWGSRCKPAGETRMCGHLPMPQAENFSQGFLPLWKYWT